MKGGLDGVGKQLLNQAGEAVMGAAKEFLGNAIQEMFIQKKSDVKRVLPSIQHMKIVSFLFDPSPMTEKMCQQSALCYNAH